MPFVVSACASTSGSEERSRPCRARPRSAAWRASGCPPKNMNRPSWAASARGRRRAPRSESSSNERFMRSSPSSSRPRSHIVSARRAATRAAACVAPASRRARSRARSRPSTPRRGRRSAPSRPRARAARPATSGSSVSSAARSNARCASALRGERGGPLGRADEHLAGRVADLPRVVGVRGRLERVDVVRGDDLDDLVLVAADARARNSAAARCLALRSCARASRRRRA